MWAKKNECGQENLSVLSVSVSVDCGVWTVDYDSAVSGEPPYSSYGSSAIDQVLAMIGGTHKLYGKRLGRFKRSSLDGDY